MFHMEDFSSTPEKLIKFVFLSFLKIFIFFQTCTGSVYAVPSALVAKMALNINGKSNQFEAIMEGGGGGGCIWQKVVPK